VEERDHYILHPPQPYPRPNNPDPRTCRDTYLYLSGVRPCWQRTPHRSDSATLKHAPPCWWNRWLPGRVFRRDAVDAYPLAVFHQVEVLAID